MPEKNIKKIKYVLRNKTYEIGLIDTDLHGSNAQG